MVDKEREELVVLDKRLFQQWMNVSVGYLLLVGILGVFLRFLVFWPVEGLVFRNFVHAHSHVAFLGWVFNALFAAIIYAFIPERTASYKWLFLLLQFSVIGMLISFPIQGYALFSISFSTLHIILSWWFAGKVWADLKNRKKHFPKLTQRSSPVSRAFLNWALFFMVLSAAGPFAIGGVMASGLSHTHWYPLSIYFYLHFQYDGWFSFAIFSLFFFLLEHYLVHYNTFYAKAFLWLMAISCIPAYSLSALWTEPDPWIYHLAGGAAALQVIALCFACIFLWHIRHQVRKLFTGYIKWSLFIAFCAYFIKLILQLASALPEIARMAYLVRSFTIGYLHLVFLGFVSFFLLGWMAKMGFLRLDTKSAKAGILVFLAGFILSELYLILQPLSILYGFGPIPKYDLSLAALSLLLPVGTVLLLWNMKQRTIYPMYGELNDKI